MFDSFLILLKALFLHKCGADFKFWGLDSHCTSESGLYLLMFGLK